MRDNFNPEILTLLEIIQEELSSGEDLYLVGGAVRDLLLKRELHDLDFVMDEDPRPLAKRVAMRLNLDFFVLDDVRHTARVVYYNAEGDLAPLDFVEFTGTTLEEDLRNRDFTINAMAVSIRDLSSLIDPLGGEDDLAECMLIPCSVHALVDDPVRVLRGIRFVHQFHLAYASSLPEQMEEAATLLQKTSNERQRDEFFRILESPLPASGLSDCYRFKVFETLIPPLVEQAFVPASPPHVLPLLDHTLSVVEHCDWLLKYLYQGDEEAAGSHWWQGKNLSALLTYSSDLEAYFDEEITLGRRKRSLMLFGALLHDIGKPLTMKMGEDGRLHFYSHDRVGADIAWEIAKSLQLSNAESDWLGTLVRCHMRILPMVNAEQPPDRRSIFRFFGQTGEVGVAVVLLSLADTLATYGNTLSEDKWKQAIIVAKALLSAWWDQRNRLVDPQPLLDGDELQDMFGLKPGKQIGKLLYSLREVQAAGEIMSKEEAISFIKARLPSKTH